MGGFLTRTYQVSRAKDDDDDAQEPHESSEFTQQLNRRGLSIPKLSTAYFVHRAVYILGKLSPPKSSCRQYLARLLSYVDTPISDNAMACRIVVKVLLKAHVLHHSDREQELGCLRRREKLQ